MIVHSFAFRWKPNVAEEQKSQVIAAIRALPAQIPALLATFVGTNFSPRSQGYELGGTMHFRDRAALEEYNTHAAHLALLSWLLPLIDPLEVDFEA